MGLVYAADATSEVLNAPTPPEQRSKWWADHAARSILRYWLRHAEGLEREVMRRRELGQKTVLPGMLGGFCILQKYAEVTAHCRNALT